MFFFEGGIKEMLRKYLSINNEVFALGFLSCITIALVFSVYFSVLTYNAGIERASLAIENTNTKVKIFAEGIFSEISNIVEVLAKNSDIINAIDGEVDVLERVLAKYSSFANANKNIRYIYSGYEDGSLLINDYVPPANFDSTLRPWYIAALTSYPQLSIGLPYQDINDGEWLLSHSKAFFNDQGELAGVFVVDCSLQALLKLIGERHDFNSQRSYIIDNTGVIIMHPDESFLQQAIPQINEQITADKGEFFYPLADREVWANYAISDSTGWTFVTAVDQDEVLNPLQRRVIVQTAVIIFLAIILVIAQVKIFKRRISEPLVDLGKRVNGIITGKTLAAPQKHSNPEITEIMQNIEQLTQRYLDRHRSELETILKSVQEGILVLDHQRSVLYANSRLRELMKIPKDKEVHLEVIAKRLGMSAPSIFSISDLESSTFLETIACDDGLILELYTCPIQDDSGLTGRLYSFRDISKQIQAVKEIEYLSFHDSLTGLYNRRFFDEELKRLDNPRNLPLTLMMIDVNGLKLTNDAFGHQTGDELLTRVAIVLKRECRADEIIARIGGDEFVILLPKLKETAAFSLANRIQDSISSETVRGLPITVSCGWATKEKASQSIDEVFKAAEDHMYRKKIFERNSQRHQSIDLIMQALYAKAPREKSHSKRVSELCQAIATAMGLDTHEITTAGLLHDIGKITISDNILNKNTSLTDLEWEEVKKHSEVGFSILSSVSDYGPLAESVLAHHERWDGKGYPNGLTKDSIPLSSRIIAVADAYAAMTSERPYQKAMSHEDALIELQNSAGSQLDPAIVQVFLKLLR